MASEEALQEKNANRIGVTVEVELSSLAVSKGKSIEESTFEGKDMNILNLFQKKFSLGWLLINCLCKGLYLLPVKL